MSQPADPERWRRLSKLFDALIDLDPSARAEMLDAECADDPALRAEIERMLAVDAVAHAFDEGVVVAADLRTGEPPAEHDDMRESIGTRLGSWRLEGVLGRGGMGTVYAARRDDSDTLQRAAIKRLHRRWDGSLQAQRFLQERRILAALSHPHLPRLLDHGLDEDQRPWFALELVQGQALTASADARRLDLRERIALFRDVCAAVQHAHEHFVVHRDLKPANILVDDDGHPKVLDFGVAKRTDHLEGATRTGAFVGFTPEYAAPEQISGGPISAATDVYALGVILYEMLSGRRPYAFDQGDLRATADAITTRPAERLEQAITLGTQQEMHTRLQQRSTDLRSFRRFVRGDLSRIVQTALAKEPPRRYASVQALSDDLKRFLEGRAVSVSGDTVGYRMRKFVLRNRWGVAMAAVAGIALLGGLAGIAMKTRDAQREAIRANAEADRAEAEAARAKREVERVGATNEFMRSVFAGANPVTSGSPDITLEKALDNALVQIQANSEKEPQLHIRLLLAASSSYEAFGDEEKALAAVRKALKIQETRLPDSKEERARVLTNLAWQRMNYEPKQSLMWAQEALPLIKASAPPGDPGIAEAYSILASAQYFNDDFEGALATMREGRQAMLDGGKAIDDADVITSLSNEAVILAGLKRYDEAIASHRQIIALRAGSVGADSLATLLEHAYLASTLNRAGRYPEALKEFDIALPGLRQQLGPEHEDVQQFLFGKAAVLANLGRNTEALPMLHAAHLYGRNHPNANRQGDVGAQYAKTLAASGRCLEAQAVIDELGRRKIDLPSGHARPLQGSRCPQ